ncbi:MAG: glutamate--cysteine ligase [Thermoplasmatota archaeon]
MNLAEVERRLQEERSRVEAFLAFHRSQVEPPITGSVDIRHSGHKVAVVDANAFPSGFHNLSPPCLAAASRGFGEVLARHGARSVGIVSEAHTRSAAYQAHLVALTGAVRGAGVEVSVAPIDSLQRTGTKLQVGGATPDAILLNQDLFQGRPAILDGIEQEVLPSPHLGWHQRRKRDHFRIANGLWAKLGVELGFDPWLLSALYEPVEDVDFPARQGLEGVASAVDRIVVAAAGKYEAYGITCDAQAFVKSDPGTYGMGVMEVSSGAEVLALSSRDRSRMDHGKGGRPTRAVLVQEGVASSLRIEGAVAEPVVYLVAGRAVGGFHRIHSERSPRQSLNRPGARFVPFQLSGADLPSAPLYALVAEVAALAMGYEAREAATRAGGEP